MELRVLVDVGIFTEERATSIRSAGQDALRRLEMREPPFGEPWPEWKPDPEWEVPKLPISWDSPAVS